MGLKKYTLVPAQNGEAAYYVDENGVKVTGIKSTKPVLVYDEDNKKYLDDKHAMAYLETLDDDSLDELEFEEEKEVENEKAQADKPIANIDVTKLQLQPNEDELAVNELLSEIGHNELKDDIQDDMELFKYFGFSKSKDFTKQSLSASDFQKGMKKMYQKFSVGFHIKETWDDWGLPNFSAYPAAEWLSWVGRMISYRSTKKDKDTNAYQRRMELRERQQQGNLNNSDIELIYNEDLQFDMPAYRKNLFLNDERSLINPLTELEAFKKIQTSIMGPLLGYGNPAGANTQFLDQKALKNGEYKYDYKAIKNFTDKAFIKDADALDFITEHMRYKEFKEENDSIIIGYNKEFEFDDLIDFEKIKYTSIQDKNKVLDEKRTELSINSAKEYNQSIYDKTNSYMRLMAIKEHRPRFYSFWHPFESRKQNKLLASMKKEITDSLIPNTDFANNITDWMNSRIGGDGEKNYKNMAKTNISEVDDPKKAKAYIDYIKEDIKINSVPEEFYKTSISDIIKEDISKDKDKYTLAKAPEKIKEDIKDLDAKRPFDPKF